MASQDKAKLQPVSAWIAQVLRCTVFPCPQKQFDVSGWWAEIEGSPPEKQTSQPRLSLQAEEGPFRDGKLVLQRNPAGIDLRLQVLNNSPHDIDGIPSIGRFKEQCPAFLDLAKKLFDTEGFPSVKRIAFGAVLSLHVEDYEEGLRQLVPYLENVKIDPPNSRDFIYRINRWRLSETGISDSLINRLSTWSIPSYRTLTAMIDSDQSTMSEPIYACQLEIDINTSEKSKSALPPKKLVALLDELVSMGTEIVENGDIS